MVERGEPIERPANYRTLIFAFAVWAAHFIISYGAVLIFPGHPAARWIAAAALLLAVLVLVLWARRLARPRSPLALGAMGLALAGVVFGTIPAFIG